MNPRVSLSGLDSVFLSLETPSTPMHMMGAFVLDASSTGGGYSYQRMVRIVEGRAPSLAPFRRRLVAMPFALDHPVWVDDPDLDVRSHVHRMRARAPGSERVLADLVARIASQPLDRARPLWQLSVIEGLAEDRVALVFKVQPLPTASRRPCCCCSSWIPRRKERRGAHPMHGCSRLRFRRARRYWPMRPRGCPDGPPILLDSCATPRDRSRGWLFRRRAALRTNPRCRCPSARPRHPGTGPYRPRGPLRSEGPGWPT
jgi:hypothetical protein